MITMDKSVMDWPEILAGDEKMATALLDRLLHMSYVLNIKGRSHQLKKRERMLKRTRAPAGPPVAALPTV